MNSTKALNTIFAKWGISADPSWNISGDPCSGKAIERNVNIQDLRFNPFIRCDCSNNKGCHITKIWIFAKNARGEIPEELLSLTELNDLNLAKNYLTGPLPAFIGNLTKLEYLSVGTNALTGKIPKELGNLVNLISLSFASNNFSSTLPAELGNLHNLKKLYIDSAGMSGEIPSNFVNLKRLEILWASGNNFIGKFPDFIGSLTNMNDLKIQGNAFQGPIPSSFSRLTNLTNLRIGELSNAGSSLEFIRKMKSLNILILRNCMIIDSLPNFIGDFPSLKHLDLSFNNITGSIPQSLFSSSSLEFLFLGNNNLSGALPINKGSKLNVIDLSYNSLSGSIPSWASNTNIDLKLSLVANSFTEDDLESDPTYTSLHCIQRNFPCNHDSLKASGFAINSGGPFIRTSNNIEFEEEDKQLGPASFYVTESRRWAVSTVGLFLESTNSSYINKTNDRITNSLDPELLEDVRLSPSIRYYGLGLENGYYTVNLQFVEIDPKDGRTWHSHQRRIFDIYIQGVLKEKDFDIKRAAGELSLRGVSKEYKKIYVAENFLEIHLFWAGKGTCCIPHPGNYGPSIGAVRVVPEFIPKTSGRNLGIIVGIPVAIGFLILIALWVTLILRRKVSLDNDEELRGIKAQTFPYSEIKQATDGFDMKNKLGEGGFGAVYKGELSDGRAVAVKRLSLRSHQGKKEFMAEINTISAVQHRNLVKLYGCCIEGSNRLLIYEYMENNSLEQALFGEKYLDLSWKNRFEICVGMGRGLAYLHEESRPKIVHRDVKASNILLDAELKPKLSDFGLAKLYNDNKTHISTRVAGTIGYLAPEYAMRGYLTDKADVFGFGVLLLEILSGRPNYAPNLSSEQAYLFEWAWFLHENSRQLELIDPRLKEVNKEEAIRIFTVGLLCTQLSPFHRPTMSRAVSMLIGNVKVTVVPSKPYYLTDLNMGNSEDFSSTSSSSMIDKIPSSNK